MTIPNGTNGAQNGVQAVCAILVGKASDPQKAEKMALAAQKCPYVALYTARGDTVIGVFELPKISQGWIEYPTQQPYILDLEKVIAVVTDQVCASSPWSRGLVRPEDELTPCQKDCQKCEQYGEECAGCAATIFYYAAE